jgi:hypothetical protein
MACDYIFEPELKTRRRSLIGMLHQYFTEALTDRNCDLAEFYLGQLIRKGGDLDAVDKNNRTAIMVAAKTGCLRIVKTLLKNDVDLSVTDNIGCTALDYAYFFDGALESLTGIIEELEAVDAKTTMKNNPT